MKNTTTNMLLVLAIFCAIALAFTGCSQEPFDDSALVGTWERTDGYKITLAADGRFSDSDGLQGQWDADEATLTVIDGQLHTFSAEYLLDGDDLTLTQVLPAKYRRVLDVK